MRAPISFLEFRCIGDARDLETIDFLQNSWILSNLDQSFWNFSCVYNTLQMSLNFLMCQQLLHVKFHFFWESKLIKQILHETYLSVVALDRFLTDAFNRRLLAVEE